MRNRLGKFSTDRVYGARPQEIGYALFNGEFLDDMLERTEVVFQDFARNITGHTTIVVCNGDVKTPLMQAYDAGQYDNI